MRWSARCRNCNSYNTFRYETHVECYECKSKLPHLRKPPFEPPRNRHDSYIHLKNFTDCDFSEMDWDHTTIVYSDFERCDFKNSSFVNVDCSYVKFINCNFSGVYFSESRIELTGAEFINCNFSGARLCWISSDIDLSTCSGDWGVDGPAQAYKFKPNGFIHNFPDTKNPIRVNAQT